MLSQLDIPNDIHQLTPAELYQLTSKEKRDKARKNISRKENHTKIEESHKHKNSH